MLGGKEKKRKQEKKKGEYDKFTVCGVMGWLWGDGVAQLVEL